MSAVWGDVETKAGEFREYETPPEGAIPARICAVIDAGTHDAHDLSGAAYERRIVILGFELGELDSKNKPFFMIKPYTLSLDVKSSLFGIVKVLHGELKLGE